MQSLLESLVRQDFGPPTEDLSEDAKALKQRCFTPLIKLIRGMSSLHDKHCWLALTAGKMANLIGLLS